MATSLEFLTGLIMPMHKLATNSPASYRGVNQRASNPLPPPTSRIRDYPRRVDHHCSNGPALGTMATPPKHRRNRLQSTVQNQSSGGHLVPAYSPPVHPPPVLPLSNSKPLCQGSQNNTCQKHVSHEPIPRPPPPALVIAFDHPRSSRPTAEIEKNTATIKSRFPTSPAPPAGPNHQQFCSPVSALDVFPGVTQGFGCVNLSDRLYDESGPLISAGPSVNHPRQRAAICHDSKPLYARNRASAYEEPIADLYNLLRHFLPMEESVSAAGPTPQPSPNAGNSPHRESVLLPNLPIFYVPPEIITAWANLQENILRGTYRSTSTRLLVILALCLRADADKDLSAESDLHPLFDPHFSHRDQRYEILLYISTTGKRAKIKAPKPSLEEWQGFLCPVLRKDHPWWLKDRLQISDTFQCASTTRILSKLNSLDLRTEESQLLELLIWLRPILPDEVKVSIELGLAPSLQEQDEAIRTCFFAPKSLLPAKTGFKSQSGPSEPILGHSEWQNLEKKFDSSAQAKIHLQLLLCLLVPSHAELFRPDNFSNLFRPFAAQPTERYAILERLYDVAETRKAHPWQLNDISRLQLWRTFIATAFPQLTQPLQSIDIVPEADIHVLRYFLRENQLCSVPPAHSDVTLWHRQILEVLPLENSRPMPSWFTIAQENEVEHCVCDIQKRLKIDDKDLDILVPLAIWSLPKHNNELDAWAQEPSFQALRADIKNGKLVTPRPQHGLLSLLAEGLARISPFFSFQSECDPTVPSLDLIWTSQHSCVVFEAIFSYADYFDLQSELEYLLRESYAWLRPKMRHHRKEAWSDLWRSCESAIQTGLPAKQELCSDVPQGSENSPPYERKMICALGFFTQCFQLSTKPFTMCLPRKAPGNN